MHPNAELIKKFYNAFQKQDADAMVACYHPDVKFHDPAFQDLDSREVRAMWHMLTERAQDFSLRYHGTAADDRHGRVHWDATYTFSKTGRKVTNPIDAEFEFKDGLIYRHRDEFDLRKWAGMALGPTGKLLGWSRLMKNIIRKNARKGLDEYMRQP
jgi:ketosteroid isomerase-like protein